MRLTSAAALAATTITAGLAVTALPAQARTSHCGCPVVRHHHHHHAVRRLESRITYYRPAPTPPPDYEAGYAPPPLEPDLVYAAPEGYYVGPAWYGGYYGGGYYRGGPRFYGGGIRYFGGGGRVFAGGGRGFHGGFAAGGRGFHDGGGGFRHGR